jgi:hypothetical protein
MKFSNVLNRVSLNVVIAAAVVLVWWWPFFDERQSFASDDQHEPVTNGLIFSHTTHAQRRIDCIVCHRSAAQSKSVVDNLLPTESQCQPCHTIDRNSPLAAQNGACAKCHRDPAAVTFARILIAPSFKFSHAAHQGAPCLQCHVDPNQKRPVTMESCFSCHRKEAVSLQRSQTCTRCHLSDATGALQTQLAAGPLVPNSDTLEDRHGPGFANDHRRAAQRPDRTCGACHRESYCSDCHNGVVKPMDFHTGNYLQVHAIESRRGTPECSSCHRAATFCLACHERSGVGVRAANVFGTQPLIGGVAPLSAGAFHPSGWAGPIGDTNQHASAARKSLTSCASCHRDNDCLACHSAQAMSIKATPHPPNWRGSSACQALDRRNRRMCLRCHVSVAQVGCNWSAELSP